MLGWFFLDILIGVWAKEYGPPHIEVNWITPTADGGYAAVGNYTTTWGGSRDLLVFKLSQDGSVEWANVFGDSGDDRGEAIIECSDGDFGVAGYTNSFGGGYDLIVLKLGSDGALRWARIVGGTNSYDYAFGLVESPDNGLVIAGYTWDAALDPQITVIKMNSTGSLQWAKQYGDAGIENGFSLTKTSDGGYIVVGRKDQGGIVLKLQWDGNPQWARVFDGLEFHGVDIGFDLSLYVTGFTNAYGAGSYDMAILKLSSDGSLIWAKTLGGSDYEYGWSVTQVDNGGCASAGWTKSFGSGITDFIIAKLASDGSLEWAKTFGAGGEERAYSIRQNAAGFIICGYPISATSSRAIVMRIGVNGDYQGCVQDCNPIIMEPTLNISSPQVPTAAWAISVGNPVMSPISLSLVSNDLCPSLYDRETEPPLSPITCFSVPGGLVFRSVIESEIDLYAYDGRLVYFGRIRKGSTRIDLRRGVYIWRAGSYRGKGIVK
ncbi:MAG: hypothetical protein ABIM74_04360 [candidate division WOR-3 bacterium]